MTPSEPKTCDGFCGRGQPIKQKCPVCEGHGIVSAGFYMAPAGQTISLNCAGPETCRTCDGRGWVW